MPAQVIDDGGIAQLAENLQEADPGVFVVAVAMGDQHDFFGIQRVNVAVDHVAVPHRDIKRLFCIGVEIAVTVFLRFGPADCVFIGLVRRVGKRAAHSQRDHKDPAKKQHQQTDKEDQNNVHSIIIMKISAEPPKPVIHRS